MSLEEEDNLTGERHSDQSSKDGYSSNNMMSEGAHFGIVEEEKQLLSSGSSANNSSMDSGDIVIRFDGVRFKRNDETEFRRVVIQNFIKRGNLGPLTENNGSSRNGSTQYESKTGVVESFDFDTSNSK